MIDISKKKFQEAYTLLKSKQLSTPLVPLNMTNGPQGHPLLLKAECLQPSGSFKIRGATYCLSNLNEKQKKAGVITYSTGNHSQAVALAARRLGIRSTIVMSPDAPEFKIASTKAFGAEVILTEPSSDKRREVAEQLAKSKGLTLVPPYDHPDIITGQGTIGMEIMDALQPAAVFVPVGGGGLIAGIAMAIKQKNPSVPVIGVEPEWENDAYQSFYSGQLVSLPEASQTIADAIRVKKLGDMTFPLILNYVDEMMTVSEEQIAEATLLGIRETHLLLEPSGALGLAAALLYQNPLLEGPIVCVASGGNTTLSFLHRLEN